MATISGTSVAVAKGVIKTTWGPFTATSDVGTPICSPQLTDKTVHVWATGTWVATTMSIQGSTASAVNYVTLNDSRGVGNALTFATNGAKVCLENPMYIRPKVTTATANATRKIYVSIVSSSQKR